MTRQRKAPAGTFSGTRRGFTVSKIRRIQSLPYPELIIQSSAHPGPQTYPANGFGAPMYCSSVYSSSPSGAPSRPMPDCFTPPNGAAAFEITPEL